MKTKNTIILSILALTLYSALYAVPTIDQNDLAEMKTEIESDIQANRKDQLDYLFELFDLIKEGKTKKVKEMLDSKVIRVSTLNKNLLYREANTCLTLAAEKGYEEIVKLLIDYGVDVNKKESRGIPPLSLAALHGHLGVVKLLLENGADVNLMENGERSHTPLYYAVWGGNVEIVKLLVLNYDVKVNNGYLLRAVDAKYGEDRSDIIKFLIDQGADANAIRKNSDRFPSHVINKSALHYTVSYINYKVPHISVANARALIEKGANVNIQDADGDTPLHYCALYLKPKYVERASKKKLKEVAKLLFKNGADVDNIKNNEGKSVRDINPELVETLEKKSFWEESLQGIISEGQIAK